MKLLSRTILRCSLAGASAFALSTATPATAQVEVRNFDIPAQPLGAALLEFSKQSDVLVVVAPELTAGKRSKPVRGAMPANEAVARLLAGSKLRAVVNPRGGYRIEADNPQSPASRDVVAATAPAFDNEMSTAEADSSSSSISAREIVVTGSIIRGATPSGANLIVLRREDLDNTGRGTLAEAIQTVPQVHGGGANDATTRTGAGAAASSFGSGSGAGVASLNLRGIGVEETLTLVNGRRLAPAGYYGAFGDISALPMAAVERVEILADGASATYGADAMAGVVNIIMNRRFEGAETRLRTGVETRSGQPEFLASQTFGWALDRGSILLSADYAWRHGITAKGRAFAASQDLRRFGGGDYRQSYCSPGNITGPAELAGAIPADQDGRALTPDQILIGETRLCDGYADRSHLTPETEKGSLYLAGSYDLTNRLRLSADVIATRRNTTKIGNYQIGYLTIPVSNAYRQTNGLHADTGPLSQAISIDYQFREVNPNTNRDKAWSLLASAGAEYRLSGDWQLSLAGSIGRYEQKNRNLEFDTRPASQGGTLEQALASSDLATAFNPFGDGGTNSRELVQSFFYPFHSLQESEYRSATLNLGGSLVDLPAGALRLAVGGDYRKESFGFKNLNFYANLSAPLEGGSFKADREVRAAYSELFIPLFSGRNAIAGAKHLSVSLSGRYDHYSDFGSTFNPKGGVTWTPVDGLTLKGTYGTSFKAPLLRSVYSQLTAAFIDFEGTAGATDVNGDGLIRTLYLVGGNPDLKPEQGRSWTAGVEIEPAMLEGLRIKATYFNLRFKGRFGQAINTGIVFADPEAYQNIAYFPSPSQSHIDSLVASAGRVVRVAPSVDVEAIIDARTLNFSSQVIDGVDAGASYRWEALGGSFNLSGDLSYLSRYKSRLGQSTMVTSYLGNVGLPTRWKVRGGLGWSSGGVSLNGSVNHAAGYANKLVQPKEPVSAYTTVDLSLQAQVAGSARSLVGDGVSLSFYVTNLFDQTPPFVNNPWGVGYDGANADPIGRRVALQLTKRW